MIRYDLKCEAGHGFDGWFSGSAAFDEQAGRGLVACPTCGSTRVEKALMTPAVPVRTNRRSAAAKVFTPAPDPRAAELLALMRKLREHVESTADYVGDRFAEEARRIHYEEVEARGIYGEATAEEARDLIDEGIEVAPLPRLPEDGN